MTNNESAPESRKSAVEGVPSPTISRALSLLDAKIGIASAEDLVAIVEARGRVIDQDQSIAAARQRRRLSEQEAWFRRVLLIAALGFGVTFVYTGRESVGFFLMGASIFSVVPDFVRSYFGWGRSDGDNAKS